MQQVWHVAAALFIICSLPGLTVLACFNEGEPALITEYFDYLDLAKLPSRLWPS